MKVYQVESEFGRADDRFGFMRHGWRAEKVFASRKAAEKYAKETEPLDGPWGYLERRIVAVEVGE